MSSLSDRCAHRPHALFAGLLPVLLVLSARPTVGRAQTRAGIAESGEFRRTYWYERGPEHGNPKFNDRFRVNAPETSLHPTYGDRREARGNGMMQIRIEEDPREIERAELYLEVWGGHPGTAEKRVTVNGRSTYALPEVGTARGHVTHQYPTLSLLRRDLVAGYNALQFACVRGRAAWGHFIVDEAALQLTLPDDHPDLLSAGLSDFEAEVRTEPRGERIRLALEIPERWTDRIARVAFFGRYRGYDENGDGEIRDWHGFTKRRRPEGHLGTVEEAPYALDWSTRMLPSQEGMAVRAEVQLEDRPGLRYRTPVRAGLTVSERQNREVRLYRIRAVPEPFWSRAGERKTAVFDLDVPPDRIVEARLHVSVWDGGAGSVESYFTLNDRPFEVAGIGDHRVHYTVVDVEPSLLRRGENRVEVRSDTEHHGIEILLPGPVLAVRVTSGA